LLWLLCFTFIGLAVLTDDLAQGLVEALSPQTASIDHPPDVLVVMAL
jgi:hypothetical protein